MGQYGASADSNGHRSQPEDVQQMIAAQYTNSADSPIVAGGLVSGLATMAYAYTAGVGVVKTAAGAVLVCWTAGQTALTTAPPSGTAVDAIWVDADGDVNLSREADMPTDVCVLDKRNVAAGTISTAATTSTWGRRYAMPYGASLGLLGQDVMPMDGTGSGTPWEWYVEQPVTFYLPTSRLVKLDFTGCISASGGEAARGGWFINFRIDGADVPGSGCEFSLDNIWQGKHWEVTVELPEGMHTAHVRSCNSWGAAPVFHYNSKSVEGQQSTQYIGRVFRVWDQGVAV
ncbi:hypothetical protein GCM10009785_01650 [Brooklawnia cerclae]|uniref:Uncharacterized protein n=1 Tax=Brooklawnia cerclae TaxID=349934 RepID=A0ABX0SHK6_9ACTN|nr:hypothetical protein [Brooklawnia cerclae]NIH56241.1 hypothetical protein [Brooklawnia cerclae]